MRIKKAKLSVSIFFVIVTPLRYCIIICSFLKKTNCFCWTNRDALSTTDTFSVVYFVDIELTKIDAFFAAYTFCGIDSNAKECVLVKKRIDSTEGTDKAAKGTVDKNGGDNKKREEAHLPAK